ncbi:MAG: hypothetical protein LAP38_09735 [Acidobacteriia bacterium]|nr:hypothetical protein [Terriglobia bacterium]
MRIFDTSQAQHFCKDYGGSSGIVCFQDFFRTMLAPHARIKEGDRIFNEYRDCLLREAERNLFLSASLHRRGLDLVSVASANWLHVTYYYSSFFSARCILGVCGTWVDSRSRTEVVGGNPGTQEIEVVRDFRKRTTYRGTHERFWDSFYTAVGALVLWVPAEYRVALTPVYANVTWLIETRNKLNYDTVAALDLSAQFRASFNRRSFPHSLPGELNTQFTIAEKLLLLAAWLGRQCGLGTDALHLIHAGSTRLDAMRRYIYDAKPARMGSYSRRQQVLKP